MNFKRTITTGSWVAFAILTGATGYEFGLHENSSTSSSTTSSLPVPTTSTIRTTLATTTTINAQVVAATQVDKCEQGHQMTSQFTQTSSSNTGSQEFEGCEWPPSSATQSDGYWEVKIFSQPGPGTSEASGSNMTFVLNPTCKNVTVTLQFGLQGATSALAPIVLTTGEITSAENLGQVWTGTVPYPYVPSNDIAILTNSSYSIEDASCVS